jgi:hypothetical protein
LIGEGTVLYEMNSAYGRKSDLQDELAAQRAIAFFRPYVFAEVYIPHPIIFHISTDIHKEKEAKRKLLLLVSLLCLTVSQLGSYKGGAAQPRVKPWDQAQ